MCSAVMCQSVRKMIFKSPCRFPALLFIGSQHIEGVHIGVIDVNFCRYASCPEVFDILERFCIKRLPVTHKCIGRRESPIDF